MPTNNAIKATAHFYFTTSVLKYAKEHEISIGDRFDCGEDCFVVELYPYTNAILRHSRQDELTVLESLEQFEELAELFWAINERDDIEMMPDLDEFKLDIERTFDRFLSND